MQRMKSVRPNADEKHAWILPLQRLQWKKTSPCIARQPILTSDEEVVGYELFFSRGPGQNRLPPTRARHFGDH